MRAFIFSLDAFVAFTLALVAIYTLIFFSSIPSSYYYLLTQGHYLAKDTLSSLSASSCSTQSSLYSCTMKYCSLLDNIAFAKNSNDQMNNIDASVGEAIPEQFGYIMEYSTDNGETWTAIYDTGGTAKVASDAHATKQRKLSVSSQILAYKNPDSSAKNDPNPFTYRTCGAGASGSGSANVSSPCAGFQTSEPSGSGENAGDLVPQAGFRLVRLTIFI